MLKKIARASALVAGLIGALSIVSCSNTSHAQSGAGIPVIIMGEDSDKRSIPRDSDIFRRVINELKSQMSRYNFYVIDEEMLAVEFGWKMRKRRPKTELIQVVDLANQGTNMAYHSKAFVTFKIVAQQKDMDFAKKAFVRISGEVYDSQARRFISSYEVPKLVFPIQTELIEDVGDRARDIAASLGDALRKHLAFVSRGSATATTGAASGPQSGGMAVTYSFVFRNFATREVMEMTGVMEDEFAGFQRAQPPQGDSAVFRYGYVSTAKANKLYRWLNVLISDMGMSPDRDVKITMRGTTFEVNKMFDSPAPSGGVPKKCKYC